MSKRRKKGKRKLNLKRLRIESGTERRRLLNRDLYKKACEICGFDRYIELAHIIRSCDGGTIDPQNILTLCPNHHRLLDRKLLNKEELDKIRERLEKQGIRHN